MEKFILLFLIINYVAGDVSIPVITTAQGGTIKGKLGDGDYAAYYGVPFGVIDETKPFGPATRHPGITDTYEAYDDSVQCPQFAGAAPSGTIQCLQLNVYVPLNATPDTKLPVITYFHGGSFVQGSKALTNFSPKFLTSLGVIVVIFNYRVGPFGFLCVSEPGYSNQGLKDQRLALQWIKDNIEVFGGDATKITGMGQSAGAMSLDLQLLVNENLIQRAIVQSGSALSTWAVGSQNDSIPIALATNLGYTGNSVTGSLDYLATKDPLQVIQSARDTGVVNPSDHPLTIPCVETAGEDAILTDYPLNLKPKVKGMDLMIGHTNKEVMFIYPKVSDTEYYSNYEYEMELRFTFNEINDIDIIRHFYTCDEPLSAALQDKILDYGTDLVFTYPAERTVVRYLEANANNVYRYRFDYEGGRNRIKIAYNITTPGACHGDDLGYLFDYPLFAGTVTNEADQHVLDTMTTMWTNFAKYGNPTPEPVDVTWPPVTAGKEPYLNIDKEFTIGCRPFHDRMAFWDLYYKYHADAEKPYNYKPNISVRRRK